MVQGWLAGKVSGLIIFCLACASIPLAIIATVQTVRLDGVSLFGWHIVDGAIHAKDVAVKERDKALSDLGISRGNQKRLQAALDESSASIRKLEADGKARTAAADAALAKERAKGADLQRRYDRLNNMKIDTTSPGAAAISIGEMLQEGVQ